MTGWQLTYNSKVLGGTALSKYVITNLTGIASAPPRQTAIENVGRNGGITYNRLDSIRRIVIDCELEAQDLVEYLDERQDLLAAMDFDYVGDLNIKLYSSGTVILERNITAKVIEKPDFPEDPGDIAVTNFTIVFNCDQPNFRGSAQNSLQLNLSEATGLDFPIDFPASFGLTGNNIGIANNAGNAIAVPSFSINAGGGISNPRISNATTGKTFSIDRTLAAGDIVTVSVQDFRTIVTLNGNQSIRSNFTGEAWDLRAGANVISFTASAFDQTAQATINWFDTYKGI